MLNYFRENALKHANFWLDITLCNIDGDL